jgi:D-arabinose 1-dehydrogenase-like Zn-dependent alcohol dehydrogenase
MSTMRVAQVPAAGKPLEIVERALPEPGAGEVRIRVEACGICHSDVLTATGHWPGIVYPRAPGHEVAGVVDKMGTGTAGWAAGDRVGLGWHGGHCGHCESCRRGNFVMCMTAARVPGIHYDGGYAEYVIAPGATLARIPEGMSAVDAAPLMCAGVTTFNSLRNAAVRPPDLVAVLGIGGLGHLGVQFASKMGFRTAAIARGKDKEALARKLGADHYIDSTAGDPAAALQKLGGARVILATVTSGKAMEAVLGGLAHVGVLVVLGAADAPLSVSALALIGGRRSVRGWPSGSAIDSQDTLVFSARNGVTPMTETYPLARAADAYARMMSGDARFRVVLTPKG